MQVGKKEIKGHNKKDVREVEFLKDSQYDKVYQEKRQALTVQPPRRWELLDQEHSQWSSQSSGPRPL